MTHALGNFNYRRCNISIRRGSLLVIIIQVTGSERHVGIRTRTRPQRAQTNKTIDRARRRGISPPATGTHLRHRQPADAIAWLFLPSRGDRDRGLRRRLLAAGSQREREGARRETEGKRVRRGCWWPLPACCGEEWGGEKMRIELRFLGRKYIYMCS